MHYQFPISIAHHVFVDYVYLVRSALVLAALIAFIVRVVLVEEDPLNKVNHVSRPPPLN